jgi:small subunit ribosomal protein S8
MVDTISSLIINLKNANFAGKASVSFPYSKLREAILVTLEKEGYVKNISKKGKKVTKAIEVELLYVDGKSRIAGVEQVSKQSRRVYQGVNDIRSVQSGFGSLILTTPKGVLTDRQARKEKVGGEALFKIW